MRVVSKPDVMAPGLQSLAFVACCALCQFCRSYSPVQTHLSLAPAPHPPSVAKRPSTRGRPLTTKRRWEASTAIVWVPTAVGQWTHLWAIASSA
jgi:hypothetical protein